MLPNPFNYRKIAKYNSYNALSFLFINKLGSLSGDSLSEIRWNFLGLKKNHKDIGWEASSESMLWRYNLHYMDFLTSTEIDSSLAIDIYKDWIANNPPGKKVSWDPYPLSLRIVNSIKWLCKEENQNPEIIQSLYHQAKFLEGNLEYHLRGNHLLANIKALIFASVFFWRGCSNLF